MLGTLLVPLDGSPAAEAALPVALKLARSSGAEVVLVRATLALARGGSPDPAALAAAVADAETYLDLQAARIAAAGVPVRTAAPYGPAAECIVDNAQLQAADLIVMSAHGASNTTRWGHGGVAEKVVEGAEVPVMLLPATPAFDEGLYVLVPLDGSRLAESVLPWVPVLGAALRWRPLLLAVVKAASPGRGHASEPTMMAREAQEYLDGVGSSLGVREVVRTEICAGDPAARILERMQQRDIGLTVLCSHGRTGVGRWAQGSVTDKVLHHSATPILLKRAPGTTSSGTAIDEAPACHNCGRRVFAAGVDVGDACARCGYPLRSCANCQHFDGVVCVMGNPWSRPVEVATHCPDFVIRRRS